MEYKCNKIKLNKKSFHYNVYDELIEIYKDYDFDKNFYELFFEDYFELIKEEKDEIFKKFNSDLTSYKFLGIKLAILKKNFIGIEKGTCVFIYHNYHKLILFYLKIESKNSELAKEIWIKDLDYGRYLEKNYKFDIIEKNKDKFIVKNLEMNDETEIIVQKSLNIIENKNK